MIHPRVLVVANDPRWAWLLTAPLRQEGYEVLDADNVAEACRLAEHDRPDLIMIDVDVPRAAERLAEVPYMRFAPVIYVSDDAALSPDQIEHRFGLFSILHKPFDAEDVLHALGFVTAFAA